MCIDMCWTCRIFVQTCVRTCVTYLFRRAFHTCIRHLLGPRMYTSSTVDSDACNVSRRTLFTGRRCGIDMRRGIYKLQTNKFDLVWYRPHQANDPVQ